MGFKVTLTVKHIRGHSFDIECQRDADVLGLKVLIWELQNIPIEKQRLVHSGREMEDSATLQLLEINDGDMIFLVESDPATEKEKDMVPITTRTEFEAIEVVSVNLPQLHANVPAPDAYAFLDEESQNESRINDVVALSFWVRLYFVVMVLLNLVGCFDSILWLIPAIFYVLGWVGARRLNRCLLIAPIIIISISLILSFLGIGVALYYWTNYWFLLLISILVVVIVMQSMVLGSIAKLICRVGKLRTTEYRQCRARISKSCCYC